MPEKADSLLAELEEILGMTTEEVAAIEVDREKRVPKWAALVDAYRSIVDLARRELGSAYDHLFQQVAEMSVPVVSAIEAFAEEQKASGPRPLFQAVKAEFDELLRSHGTKTEGEWYVPANGLLNILQRVFRPPRHSGSASFYELGRDLETTVRLANPLRNAIGWVLARAPGDEADERRRAEIDKQLAILWDWYLPIHKHSFSPEVRRKILYKQTGITPIAELIFGSSEYSAERPVETVATATRLESPAREGALGLLAFALVVYILNSPGLGEQRVATTSNKLKPLMHNVVGQLFSKDKVERLKEWLGRATFASAPVKDIEQQVSELSKRLTNLESILSHRRLDKYERQERLSALVANILEFLREETTHPRRRWPGREMALAGEYCEFLWENAVDDAFGPHSDADKYQEWEWLELRRSIKELALNLETDTLYIYPSYGWRI
jgi:hypothetical protein